MPIISIELKRGKRFEVVCVDGFKDTGKYPKICEMKILWRKASYNISSTLVGRDVLSFEVLRFLLRNAMIHIRKCTYVRKYVTLDTDGYYNWNLSKLNYVQLLN